MALRIFVSYPRREDQVLALRLQALASTRPELFVYVPPAHTRSSHGAPTEIDLQQLRQSNLVLGFISGAVSPAMQAEINTANSLRIPVIPIVWGHEPPPVSGIQPQQVLYVDPQNPSELPTKLVEALVLRSADVGKANQAALTALLLIILGLLILAKD